MANTHRAAKRRHNLAPGGRPGLRSLAAMRLQSEATLLAFVTTVILGLTLPKRPNSRPRIRQTRVFHRSHRYSSSVLLLECCLDSVRRSIRQELPESYLG